MLLHGQEKEPSRRSTRKKGRQSSPKNDDQRTASGDCQEGRRSALGEAQDCHLEKRSQKERDSGWSRLNFPERSFPDAFGWRIGPMLRQQFSALFNAG